MTGTREANLQAMMRDTQSLAKLAPFMTDNHKDQLIYSIGLSPWAVERLCLGYDAPVCGSLEKWREGHDFHCERRIMSEILAACTARSGGNIGDEPHPGAPGRPSEGRVVIRHRQPATPGKLGFVARLAAAAMKGFPQVLRPKGR